MLKLKDDSIDPNALQPQLILALMVAQDVYKNHGVHTLIITSLNDARHMKTSLHYIGAAVDLSIYELSSFDPDLPRVVKDEIKAALNMHYDVLLEANHIHIEYQRRGYK